MLAVDYQAMVDKLDDYCDKVIKTDEALVVRRKGDKNVVLVSLHKYDELEKAVRNAAYLKKIDDAIEQLESGGGTAHELIEDDE